VEFLKAFDKISQYKLWKRIVAIGVPSKLNVEVSKLYKRIIIRFSSINEMEVLSTLKIIQRCHLLPTLFGLFIDQLHI
jgi:hypothetical protein